VPDTDAEKKEVPALQLEVGCRIVPSSDSHCSPIVEVVQVMWAHMGPCGDQLGASRLFVIREGLVHVMATQ
jgi:hypothetical protein